MQQPSAHAYQRLRDDVASDDTEEKHLDVFFPRKYHGQRFIGVFWIVNACWSLISIAIIVGWLYEANSPNYLLKRTSNYSPIFDRLKITTATKQTQGSLFPPSNPSIGRAFPNPLSDAVWEEIELTRTIVISAEDVRKLEKDPRTAAKFDNRYWALGDDAYMGQIDVFHQLHCLNTMRKLAYPEYYASENKERDEMWYIHHNHCVDILLQNLMCSANVDIITLNWMETQTHPFPDFSINHQCRDFEALLRWRKENSVEMGKWDNMTKPDGITEVPAPREYYELFGRNGSQASKFLHNHKQNIDSR